MPLKTIDAWGSYITFAELVILEIMDTARLLERTKKQLRSVLISEKGGVAADRLERDYRDLVDCHNSNGSSYVIDELDVPKPNLYGD